MNMWTKLFLVNSLISAAVAYPSLSTSAVGKRDSFPSDLAERLGEYIPPGPTDSRGPCPGLNTLANHGLINRDGRNIKSDDVPDAFARGFGVAFDGIATALHNWEVVCEYVTGQTCGVPENNGTFILANLTLLGEPHAFEHDHSYSRQDYKQAWANGAITDNISFNSSAFQSCLDVVGYQPSNPPTVALANYQQINQIRLQRESLQYSADYPNSFIQNIPPTLFETGFIFGVTFDRDAYGNMLGSEPQVRLDWWTYWFTEESFPTQLGWVPASTAVFNAEFILSVSRTILQQVVTSTPTNLPASALATDFPPPSNLPEGDPNELYELFQGPPYVAPVPPSAITPAITSATPVATTLVKRSTKTTTSAPYISHAAVTPAPKALHGSTTATAGHHPTHFDWYQQKLDVHSVRKQVALARSYQRALASAISSIV